MPFIIIVLYWVWCSMPRISVRTQLLGGVLALVLICIATVLRFYSYVEKGIDMQLLYKPLLLWTLVFIDYGIVLYVSYLKEVLGKHIPSYKTIVYAALAILTVCMAWAIILEYKLQY